MRETWLGVDKMNTAFKNSREEQAGELNKDYLIVAQCFNTEAGKKALEILKERTTELPTWVPGLSTDFGFYREGQNSVLNFIDKSINYKK